MACCGAVKPRRGFRARRFGTICRQTTPPRQRVKLASRSELSAFLEGVERRAFKQAVFAVRDEEAALDIVQDAMLRLAEKYGHRPAAELPLLFHRITQNAIRDWFRRQKVRSLWTTLLSSLVPGRGEDEDQDPLETLQSADQSKVEESPAVQLERAQVLEIIEQEISRLPERQRQAFIMRYWEELDVAETAQVMGCSEGSVKTHCSRAAHTLAQALRARGITL
jgi:RNA polymerase sigma-70 factor, ECF subfamily